MYHPYTLYIGVNLKYFIPIYNFFYFLSTLQFSSKNAKFIAKTIVKRATGRELINFTVETQREFKGIEPDKRGIRLDVLVSVSDPEGNVQEIYDIEPNDYYEVNLAKRTRFYNALTYDPFGDNRMIYTVKNIVTDNPHLEYNDGVTNLFLNTKGETGGSEELKNLLHHMTNTTSDNALDSDLEQIQQIVDSVKRDREVGERYMSMEKIMKSAEYHGFMAGQEKGMAQGIAQGISQSIQIFVDSMLELDISPSFIKNKLIDKFNLSESEADEYLKNIN